MSANAASRLDAANRLRRAKAAIIGRDRQASLAAIIAGDRAAFSGCRLLFASDHDGIALQEMFSAGPAAIPLANMFCGRGFLAFSDQIEEEMLQERCQVRLLTPVVLDNNFMSDLRSYVTGEDFQRREQFEDTLDFIEERAGRSLDYRFASLENLRQVSDGNIPWPYRELAAALFFTEAPASFRAARGKPAELDKFLPLAEQQWQTWFKSPGPWDKLIRRDVVYCILLRTLIECWTGSTLEVGLSRLVTATLDSFGFFPLKELYFGWKALRGFLSKDNRLSIFSEPKLRHPREGTIKRVRALAWDLFIFRWCETLTTEYKGNTFGVPVVTSFDQGLLEAIQLCPLRAVLIHDDERLVEAIFDDDLEFQQALNDLLPQSTKERIAEQTRYCRNTDVSRHALSSFILQLEKEVGTLVAARERDSSNRSRRNR